MNKEEIFKKMQELIAESLAVPAGQVTLKSRFIDDLGADSLDILDFLFTIKKKFNVNIQPKEINFFASLDFTNPAVIQHGFLTKETIDKLKEWLPAINDVDDPQKITPAKLFSLITVETLCIIVEKKLAGQVKT